MIKSFEQYTPQIDASAFVSEAAYVNGNVIIGADSSVWPMVSIRGDIHAITIGERTNIQDGSVLHITHASDFAPGGGFPLTIGNEVIVGHNVTLHGCTIHDNCLVGMGSIVLDGAIVESNVMIGAASLVPPGKTLKSGFMYLGSPVKQARPLTEKEQAFLSYSPKHYAELGKRTARSEQQD